MPAASGNEIGSVDLSAWLLGCLTETESRVRANSSNTKRCVLAAVRRLLGHPRNKLDRSHTQNVTPAEVPIVDVLCEHWPSCLSITIVDILTRGSHSHWNSTVMVA